MDCYSAESDFIESLDFLSPPVKRINSSRQAFGSARNTDTNNVHLLRGFHSKFVRRTPSPTKHTKAVKNSESSTSLVLQKTSEGQILGQHSFLSFPSLYQPVNNFTALQKTETKPNTAQKPLIKVTVIPKTDQVQAAKLLRRRRNTPKKVLSTTSNHENSIQTKNVYLIVAGRRKEKIYEIKTTGSAKLSTDHGSYTKNEVIPITELTNIKHLIQSLNMDGKKKKEKKRPKAAEMSHEPQNMEWQCFPKCNNCICLNELKESPKKSHLRIFGQFGIAEDNNYVLRYGATVDDKQVMSDVAQLNRDFSPIIDESSYGTTEEQLAQQQDSCLQADYNYDLDMKMSPMEDVVSKESQGTQVNLNIQVAATKGRCATFSDKMVQCRCFADRSDHNTLKDCQSPMVIISVYPKLSPEDLMKSVHCPAVSAQSSSPAGAHTYTSNHVIRTEKPTNKSDTRRNFKSPQISRSPSPVIKASRSKVTDYSPKGPASGKRSPDHQKALKAIKEKIREKDKLKQDASSRKPPLKLNTTNATQDSNNLQNLASNSKQISKRNQQFYIASQTIQMSNKNHELTNMGSGTQGSTEAITIKNNTNATQYSNEGENLAASDAMQCEDTLDSLQGIAPIKPSANEGLATKKYLQNKSPPIKHLKTQVSNATQVPKIQQFFSNHATQISEKDPSAISCATQVPKTNPNLIASRKSKNKKTFTKPAQGFKSEQTSRIISKTKAESGTNTDHARAKKALVETYTKKLTEQMNKKEYIPARYDNSMVTINIDGDRDYYDVLFNRDKLSTDLTIRKTLKDMCPQKCTNQPSLGSLLRLPDCALEEEGLKCGNKSLTRCPSIILYNNPTNEELPLIKHVSRLTIRDSIEIRHSRDDRSNNNIKNTQTCFTAQLDTVPDETEFLAPIKHFTGDDCSICDPIERDKQIRELLGVDKVKPNFSKTSQGRFCENDVGIPYEYIYQQKCKESQVTEINYEIHNLCPCFKTVNSKEAPKATVSVQCRACRQENGKERLSKNPPEHENDLCFVNYTVGGGKKKDEKTSTVYQQLILNRNIQVFLQVEQFSKQKPILLSRQQYDKVKKTIQKTVCMKKSSQGKRKTLLSKPESSQISIGEVRTKKVKESHQELVKYLKSPEEKAKYKNSTETAQGSRNEAAAQTDAIPGNTYNCKQLTGREGRSVKPPAYLFDINCDCSSDQSSDGGDAKIKKTKIKQDTELKKPHPIIKQDVKAGPRKVDRTERPRATENCSACCLCKDHVQRSGAEVKTYVLFNSKNTRGNLKDAKETEYVAHPRKTMSSVEIRYASVALTKQVAYSSTDVGGLSDSSIGHFNSFHTLFRGHRKSATPNLGTSACSLYSEDNFSENKCAKLEPQDSKPKKPFLRRLMSCLVMRSTGDSELKLPIGPPPDLPSVNSSIDSYHINTSLGAVEVSSSIYDTSASFYSNHTIFPVNTKIKRGFFSSVRGFLTNRKS